MARVLLIDDDDHVRAALRLMLEREGFEVWDAPDGESGLALFRAQQIDLVITDLIMPEREGLSTIMQIHNESPSTTIIAISGASGRGDGSLLDNAVQLGASCAFSKPLDRKRLIDAVRAAANPRGAPQTLEP